MTVNRKTNRLPLSNDLSTIDAAKLLENGPVDFVRQAVRRTITEIEYRKSWMAAIELGESVNLIFRTL